MLSYFLNSTKVFDDNATTNPAFKPIQTYHLGLWFNSSDDAKNAGCAATVTPPVRTWLTASSIAAALDAVAFADPRVPVVCNVDAEPAYDANTLRERLRRQLTDPVRWEDSVRPRLECRLLLLAHVARLRSDTLSNAGITRTVALVSNPNPPLE